MGKVIEMCNGFRKYNIKECLFFPGKIMNHRDTHGISDLGVF
jgi:hypothetical protein